MKRVSENKLYIMDEGWWMVKMIVVSFIFSASPSPSPCVAASLFYIF